MRTNVGLIHLRDTGLPDLSAIGLTPTGRSIHGDQAWGVTSALQVGPDLLAVDGDPTLAAEPEQLASRLGTRVVSVLLGSTSDTYSLAVTESTGGTSTLIRHLVDSQVGRMGDEGEPLPQESGMQLLDEDSCSDLFDELTGIHPWAPDPQMAETASGETCCSSSSRCSAR